MDYFDWSRTLLFLDEPGLSLSQGRATRLEYEESMRQRLECGMMQPEEIEELFSEEYIAGRLEGLPGVMLSNFSGNRFLAGTNSFSGQSGEDLLLPREVFSFGACGVSAYNGHFLQLVKDLKEYGKEKNRVCLLSGSRTRARRLAEDLQSEGIRAFYTEDREHAMNPGEVLVCHGKIKRGFAYPELKLVEINESDIFGGEKKPKRKRSAYQGEKISGFTDLAVGDYVVHENHGVGIYRGMEQVTVSGIQKDYIKIEYADGGNLYIQATQLYAIQKVASKDAGAHRLNRLGGSEWKKTKARVKGAVEEVAQELVELYALRQQQEGFVYGPDTVWQREFEEMFPYEETEDQLLAIEAVKRDMESRKIMDRLICGDVGYGKTEVAIRAAFKAVQEGKQVVYLAPTTILAQQHYNTFTTRMQDFPVRVDLLCRFCTPTQVKKTLTDLKKGLVDIVIGTHRVLSEDVEFKDLGLLMIDEEQRFGVTHKEKIKQLKKNVDVLALTATPIPRTLHMSLVGIRDMSVLEEAPQNRVPIQTYVMEYNEEIVREAIDRELARGGQVYYVFNRVNQIEELTGKIARLCPRARVAFAHGQMRERQLEDIMLDFVQGEIDVLVSTTIIETGLDISNVNTILIHDADYYGLSQLYQLRGRVGRSDRTAFAFLFFRKNKILTEDAQKRLSSIREFTQLGSGFKIAMRDLEIRGAGSLLGARQHGHIEAVGYDLYCKMLNQAVKSLKGDAKEVPFETTLELDVDAYIPENYISHCHHTPIFTSGLRPLKRNRSGMKCWMS